MKESHRLFYRLPHASETLGVQVRFRPGTTIPVSYAVRRRSPRVLPLVSHETTREVYRGNRAGLERAIAVETATYGILGAK